MHIRPVDFIFGSMITEQTLRFFKQKIVQNVLAWTLVALIIFGLVNSEDRLSTVIYNLLVIIPPVYVNNLLIAPLAKRNKALFVVLLMLNVLFFGLIGIASLMLIGGANFQWRMVSLIGVIGVIVLVGYALKFVRDHLAERNKAKEAELKLLKEQLNPHFLFNTLNNLYGLSIAKSEKVPELMLKLSELLRYSLYETQDEIVPLEKEVHYLENYMELEKVRLEEKHQIEFIRKGDFSMIQVAPMLLIVFVENAFKHMNKIGDGKVVVTIEVENDQLVFRCKNTCDEVESNETKKSGGIGLENVKQRLQLIYPKSHRLSTIRENGEFLVELTIKMD